MYDGRNDDGETTIILAFTRIGLHCRNLKGRRRRRRRRRKRRRRNEQDRNKAEMIMISEPGTATLKSNLVDYATEAYDKKKKTS